MKISIADHYDTTGLIDVNSNPHYEFSQWVHFASINPDWTGHEFTLDDFVSHIASFADDVMYASWAKKPAWYETLSTANWETACAVSGSSPFNEWYAWKDRKTAIAYIDSHFTSQSFLDSFQWIAGEFYAEGDYSSHDPEDGSDLVFTPNSGAPPACLQAMVQAESQF